MHLKNRAAVSLIPNINCAREPGGISGEYTAETRIYVMADGHVTGDVGREVAITRLLRELAEAMNSSASSVCSTAMA